MTSKSLPNNGNDKVCSHLENLLEDDVMQKFRTWFGKGERYEFCRQLTVVENFRNITLIVHISTADT